MPRSSRHKSHKQSKHSSRDYSDSEEDGIKMKEKSSKDDVSTRVRRDSASGEKRKFSSEVPEATGTKDLGGDGFGEIVEEYVSSKRRKDKERTDVIVGVDRWSGGGDDRGDSDRNVEKETHKWDTLKVGNKLKENSNKGENSRSDSKSRSKRYESGTDERKEDSLTSVLVEKEEGKTKGESKRRSERDSFTHKEGKELKDKDRRLDKERNGDEESKSGDADMNARNKQAQVVDFSEERQGKRIREIAEQTLQDELRSAEVDKEVEKKMRRKREGSGEKEKHYNDSKEGDERRLSSRVDRAKDLKYKDEKHRDGGYEDKYLEDGHKDERRRDEKYREEGDKDSKYHDDKYRDGDKSSRRRSERHRDDSERDGRRKDEKYHDDRERDGRRKDDKDWEGIEREGRRDEKYEKHREDGDRDRRRKDGRYHEDAEKDFSRGDERYRDGGDKDDRRRDSSYRDDSNRDSRHKEEKYREDIERDSWHKDSKQGDERDREKKGDERDREKKGDERDREKKGDERDREKRGDERDREKRGDERDREKRPRDPKYRDERGSRDHTSCKSDHKHAKDDDYPVDHHTIKSNAYDDIPDDRSARYRRTNEKEDYGDSRHRGAKNQRSDTERISSSGAKMELITDRARVQKQDESRHGDYNYEERTRPVMSSTTDHSNALGGTEKSSQSLEKLGKKDDGQSGEVSAERCLKSDIRPSPSKVMDKSPSSSIDRRQFSRPDTRRSIDAEESTQRSGGSRDRKEYSGKEGRGNQELSMDAPPGDEPLQADADTVSVSSPFMRNSHFSNSSKSMAPPPFRTGLGSPSLSGSAEDEGRGKSNMRHRRTGDPNMGRIQGNAWGGVPGWPSPVPNGFMPFPPHVSFPSVMQPFPAPSMFGVRPSMEFDHSAPYHMPDADRFPGPMRPMGWGHHIDNSGPPLHSWDANNTGFTESHVYGRSDWDHCRNLPGDRSGETSGDLWRGPNRTGSMEMPYSEKENDSARAGQVFSDGSNQPLLNEPIQCDQLVENKEHGQLNKSSENNDVNAPLTSLEDTSDVTKLSGNDDIRLCRAYLSKLDISADLTEPELFNECNGLIDMDKSMISNVDEYKILSMEDEEPEFTCHGVRSNTLFAPTDDSIFQKSMSLYKRQKEKFLVKGSEKPELLNEFILSSNQEDQNAADDTSGKLFPKDIVPDHPENTPQKADKAGTSQDLVSAMDMDGNRESNSLIDLGQQDPGADKPLSAGSVEGSETPPSQDAPMELACNKEVKLVDDTKCSPMLNSDVASEAMLPESIMLESDNLSRIHLSPESTH